MIIHDLDVKRVAILPEEANAPLIVNSHTPLSAPIPCEFFQSIGGWNPQIIQCGGSAQHSQFSQRCLLNIGGQLP
jgi:alanine-alpha-ketoisovalerate/valine-pyruvate aminotransferase